LNEKDMIRLTDYILCPQKKVRGRFEGEKIHGTDQRTHDQIEPLNLSNIIHVISLCISLEVFSRAPDSLKNPLDCRDFSPCSLQSRGYHTDEAQYPKIPMPCTDA
jgi:hypothetical protein